MKKTHVLIVVVAAIAAIAAFAILNGEMEPTTSEQQTTTKFFNFGASPATASMYPYWVAVGKAIQTVYPEYQITVSESRGGVDVSHRVRAGDVVLGNGVARVDYENYHGLGDFEGEPFEKARVLWYYDMTYFVFIASKESGFRSFTELDGKRINTGGTGTSMVAMTVDIMDKLGVAPIYYDASKADASDAYGNRQIVGMPSGGSLPDSFIMQLNATLPVNILSLTEAEFATVTAGHPYYTRGEIPAGTYSGVDYDVLTVAYPQGCQSSSNLSQEDAYKFVKAVFDEGKSYWETTMPTAANLDPIDMVLKSSIPIHAGMIQYIKEKGRFDELRPEQIPPEYADR